MHTPAHFIYMYKWRDRKVTREGRKKVKMGVKEVMMGERKERVVKREKLKFNIYIYIWIENKMLGG